MPALKKRRINAVLKQKAHLLLAVRFFEKIFIFDATKLD
jgi:hypothetical protein